MKVSLGIKSIAALLVLGTIAILGIILYNNNKSEDGEGKDPKNALSGTDTSTPGPGPCAGPGSGSGSGPGPSTGVSICKKAHAMAGNLLKVAAEALAAGLITDTEETSMKSIANETVVAATNATGKTASSKEVAEAQKKTVEAHKEIKAIVEIVKADAEDAVGKAHPIVYSINMIANRELIDFDDSNLIGLIADIQGAIKNVANAINKAQNNMKAVDSAEVMTNETITAIGAARETREKTAKAYKEIDDIVECETKVVPSARKMIEELYSAKMIDDDKNNDLNHIADKAGKMTYKIDSAIVTLKNTNGIQPSEIETVVSEAIATLSKIFVMTGILGRVINIVSSAQKNIIGIEELVKAQPTHEKDNDPIITALNRMKTDVVQAFIDRVLDAAIDAAKTAEMFEANEKDEAASAAANAALDVLQSIFKVAQDLPPTLPDMLTRAVNAAINERESTNGNSTNSNEKANLLSKAVDEAAKAVKAFDATKPDTYDAMLNAVNAIDNVSPQPETPPTE